GSHISLEQLFRSLNPHTYQRRRRVLESGPSPAECYLTNDQRELCLEAVIHYEKLHQVAAQYRVGYLDLTKSSESACSKDHDHAGTDADHDEVHPVRWIN